MKFLTLSALLVLMLANCDVVDSHWQHRVSRQLKKGSSKGSSKDSKKSKYSHAPSKAQKKGKKKTKNKTLTTPSTMPSTSPSQTPSKNPSETPSKNPSETPSESPSITPSANPSESPSISPSETPSKNPSETPSKSPSITPSANPSESPSMSPSETPSKSPSIMPSANPSESPSTSPSKTPSMSPSETPSNSVNPSESPTPVCENRKELNVCIAIDNSGSVCSANRPLSCDSGCRPGEPFPSNGSCGAGTKKYEDNGGTLGENSCCGNYQLVKDFTMNYIDSLTDGEGSVSVVQFGNIAKVIFSPGTKSEAIEAINSNLYIGGYTNTEDAITKCTEEVKDLVNPVIVLITDGTPSACTTNDSGGYRTEATGQFNMCTYGAPEPGAISRANWAAENGVTIVPVVIQTVETDIEFLQNLARCPSSGGSSSQCNTEDFKDFRSEDVDGLANAVGNLVRATLCEDE